MPNVPISPAERRRLRQALDTLWTASAELSQAGVFSCRPYANRIQLIAALAEALSKQVYDDIEGYEASHGKGQSNGQRENSVSSAQPDSTVGIGHA